MAPTVIVIRPERDDVEDILSVLLAEPFVGAVEGLGASVTDLRGAHASRSKVSAALGPAALVLYVGHGGDAHLGADDLPLLDAENVGNAAGGMIVAIACFSARKLGRQAVASGVSTYIGSTGYWPVYLGPTRVIARSFVEFLADLAAGVTPRRAVGALRQRLRAIREAYLHGPEATDRDSALVWLTANAILEILIVRGDQDYRHPQGSPPPAPEPSS